MYVCMYIQAGHDEIIFFFIFTNNSFCMIWFNINISIGIQSNRSSNITQKKHHLQNAVISMYAWGKKRDFLSFYKVVCIKGKLTFGSFFLFLNLFSCLWSLFLPRRTSSNADKSTFRCGSSLSFGAKVIFTLYPHNIYPKSQS